MDIINDLIWQQSYWLPNKFTWKDVEQYKESNSKFYLTIFYFAIIIYFIRVLFEKLVFTPIGRYFNLKDKLNHKNGPYRASKLKKFNESSWRFIYYFSIWLYGLIILYNKSWIWSTKEVWIDYPAHWFTSELYYYYVISCGFYVSLLFSQFFDVKRKDFWQMFAHHVVTISLIVFSYITNYTRIGCLIIVIHDSADYWLELAKIGLYIKNKFLSHFSFGMFTFVWFVTRLVIFPSRVLYTTTVEGLEYLHGTASTYPAYYIFNFLLISLQIMHIIWFIMIVKVLLRILKSDKKVKDERSDSESDDEKEE